MTIQLAAVVYVYSSGHGVRSVTSTEAVKLLHNGWRVRKVRKGRVMEIQNATPGKPIKPPSMPRIADYMGQRYTRVETMRDGEIIRGHVMQFRRIHPDDQAIFLQAITDCGGKLVRRKAVGR